MHGGEEEKRSTAMKVCSQSVEKVWFTDTPKGEDFSGRENRANQTMVLL